MGHPPPPPPPTPQLLEVKETSYNKVPLVRMPQDDPLNPSSTKNYQVDSENNNQGESNMIEEKVIKNPYLLESRSEWPSGNENRIPIPYT